MMRYVLDTATWVNSVTMPKVLPARIRKLIGTATEPKGLCAISMLECAVLHRRGRLKLAGSLDDFFTVALADDIEVLELTPAIAAATNKLPADFPGDPFDRTIAATAHVMNLTLITPDPLIRDANFCEIEFYPFRPVRSRK